MDNYYIEDRIACRKDGALHISNIEEKMVERELKEQDEMQKRVNEERDRQEKEVFGRIFQSI